MFRRLIVTQNLMTTLSDVILVPSHVFVRLLSLCLWQ